MSCSTLTAAAAPLVPALQSGCCLAGQAPTTAAAAAANMMGFNMLAARRMDRIDEITQVFIAVVTFAIHAMPHGVNAFTCLTCAMPCMLITAARNSEQRKKWGRKAAHPRTGGRHRLQVVRGQAVGLRLQAPALAERINPAPFHALQRHPGHALPRDAVEAQDAPLLLLASGPQPRGPRHRFCQTLYGRGGVRGDRHAPVAARGLALEDHLARIPPVGAALH